MQENILRIVRAYLKEKKASNYVEPLLKDTPNQPFYRDQEKTYTDLTQLDSVHGPMSDKERYDKMYIFQDPACYNPDWADGSFSTPYDNPYHHEMFRTPNTNESLYLASEIIDLNTRTSSIDNFLNSGKMIKISSGMDLTDFMKVSDDTLIHKCRQDLWKMYKDADGNTYIKRLFEEDLIKD